MPKTNTSVQSVKNSNGNAPAFDKLTKAELIELTSGDIKAPITPAELYRCAASIVFRWCDNVITGGFASVHSVKDQLSSLEKLYKNR